MMEILTILGIIGSACGVIGAIDIFIRWYKESSKNYRSQLPKINEENQQQIILDKVIIDASSRISQRLNKLLELLNQNRNIEVTISELTEFCGYNKEGDLKKYFDGSEEPTYKEQEYICSCIGANSEWLKHGKGEPFRSQESFETYAENYLKTIINKLPKEIIFIRSRGEDGRAGILLKLNKFKYVFLPKTWNISGCVGSTGQRQINSFRQLIEAVNDLKRTSYKFDSISITGNHIEEKDFDDLTCGEIYPGSIVGSYKDNWWDNLTDINHVWAGASSYEEQYGENFIEAQKIIKYLLDSSVS